MITQSLTKYQNPPYYAAVAIAPEIKLWLDRTRRTSQPQILVVGGPSRVWEKPQFVVEIH
jgi:hypothetical protein